MMVRHSHDGRRVLVAITMQQQHFHGCDSRHCQPRLSGRVIISTVVQEMRSMRQVTMWSWRRHGVSDSVLGWYLSE